MARKDINFNFTPHPLTGDLSTKKDSSAIKQSLKNIVLTSFYERGFNEDFGTDVRGSLFENMLPLQIETLKDLIREAIVNFEPQVEVFDIIAQNGDDEHELLITVMYTENNDPREQSVTIELERLR